MQLMINIKCWLRRNQSRLIHNNGEIQVPIQISKYELNLERAVFGLHTYANILKKSVFKKSYEIASKILTKICDKIFLLSKFQRYVFTMKKVIRRFRRSLVCKQELIYLYRVEWSKSLEKLNIMAEFLYSKRKDLGEYLQNYETNITIEIKVEIISFFYDIFLIKYIEKRTQEKYINDHEVYNIDCNRILKYFEKNPYWGIYLTY